MLLSARPGHDPRNGRARRAFNHAVNRAMKSPLTPLMDAARAGDRRAVDRLAREHGGLDERDRQGRTALHHAVLAGRAENAACLLAHGANPDVADRRNQCALGLGYASLPFLHSVRQHYQRLQTERALKPRSALSTGAQACLQQLETRGIAVLSGLLEPGALEQLRAGCQAFVDEIDSELALGRGRKQHYDEESHWWPDDQAYVTNNAFKYSSELIDLAVHPLLLEVVGGYLGRRALIQRGVGMRYLPCPPNDRDMFGWHHDMNEKRVKFMLLLTDVTPSDQAMQYALGTHTLYHPYEMFFENRCPLEYCRERLGAVDIFTAAGRAGDIIVFDSNGAHRGQRSASGAVRDVFMVEYTTDFSDLWGCDFPPSYTPRSTEVEHLFGRLLAVKKAWDRPKIRTAPTWVEDLPFPRRWL